MKSRIPWFAKLLRDLHDLMRARRGTRLYPPALPSPIARIPWIPLTISAKNILAGLEGFDRLRDSLLEITDGELTQLRLARRLAWFGDIPVRKAVLRVDRHHEGVHFCVVSSEDKYRSCWPSYTMKEARFLSIGSVRAFGGWWNLTAVERSLFSPKERAWWEKMAPRPDLEEAPEKAERLVSPELVESFGFGVLGEDVLEASEESVFDWED